MVDVVVLTPVTPGMFEFLPDIAASVTEERGRVDPTVRLRWQIVVDSAEVRDGERALGRTPLLSAPWVSLRVTGRSRGPAAARMVGLASAMTSGPVDVIAGLDADDVYVPGGLGALLGPLLDDAALGWAAGGNTWFGHVDGPRTAAYAPGGGLAGFIPPGGLYAAWEREGVFPFAASAAAYRVEPLLSAGGWPGTPTGEDAALLLAVSDREPGWAVTEPVFEYRKHPGQATSTEGHRELRQWTNLLMRARHTGAAPPAG